MKSSLAEILLDEDKIINVYKTGIYEYTEFQYEDFMLNVRKDRYMYSHDLIRYRNISNKENSYKKQRSRKSYIARWDKLISSLLWSEIDLELFEQSIYSKTNHIIANLSRKDSEFFWLMTRYMPNIETAVSLDIYNNSIHPSIIFFDEDPEGIEIRLEPLNKSIRNDVLKTFMQSNKLIGYTCIYMQTEKERLQEMIIGENNIYYPYKEHLFNGYMKCAVFNRRYWDAGYIGIDHSCSIINEIDKELKDVK